MGNGFYGIDGKKNPPLQQVGYGMYRSTHFLKGASRTHIVPCDLVVKSNGPMREWRHCEAGFVIYGDKYLIRVAKTDGVLSAVIHATGAKIDIDEEAMVQPCAKHLKVVRVLHRRSAQYCKSQAPSSKS